MTAVLEVDGLTTEFHLRRSNVTAVDQVSFHVDEGECVGIVGESGCGKTTTGLSIMKLLPPVGHVTAGKINLLGRDLVPLGEKEMCKIRGNDVGMIFQDPLTSLNPTMTIGRQIAESVKLHRHASKTEARARALEVLSLVDMPRPAERLNSYPHQLSGGLRQRVMIAMALACEPKLLVADEPTTALDVTIQAQILDLLDSLRERMGMAIMLITHDMGVIAGRTDRVLVMYAGKIAEASTTSELFHRMRHPYSEALLASVPKLEQDSSIRLISIPGLPPDLSQPIDQCRFAPRCLYVQQDCRDHEPELGRAGGDSEPGHQAACFHQVGVDEATIAKQPEAVAKSADVSVTVDELSQARQQARADELAQQPVLLQVGRLVKEFPVTTGAVIQRTIGTVKAVSDVSFSVRRGETFGLVGESGCGKTTIGRLVVALEKTNDGSITFEGDDVTRLHASALRDRRRDMQLMFQDPYASLDPRMRVGSIIKEPLVVQGIGTPKEQRGTDQEPDGRGGTERQGARPLPPRVLRRSAPTDRIGPRTCPRPQTDRGRRACLRAGRLHPGADPEPPEGAPATPPPYLHLHLPRPRRREVHGGHDRRHVPGQARRGGSGPGHLRTGRPSLHESADRHHPRARSPLARASRGRHITGELPSAMQPPSGCRFRTRCPFVQEICALEEPPLRPFGPRHLAACHFPLQTPTGDAPSDAQATLAG